MNPLTDDELAEIFEDYEPPRPKWDEDEEVFETQYEYYRYMQEECFCGSN